MHFIILFVLFILSLYLLRPEYKIVINYSGVDPKRKIETFEKTVQDGAVDVHTKHDKPVSATIDYINAQTYYNRYHNYSSDEQRTFAPVGKEQKVMMNDVLMQTVVDDIKPQNYVFNKNK